MTTLPYWDKISSYLPLNPPFPNISPKWSVEYVVEKGKRLKKHLEVWAGTPAPTVKY